MELDDLKERWRTATFQSPLELKGALEKRITALERSGRGIRRVFMIEMIAVAIIYIGSILMLWLMADKAMTYMYKLVVVTAVATIPISWRLYKAQKWVNSMDYTKDIRSNMEGFLKYFKVTLRLYQWSTYLIIVIITALMFTDNDFGKLNFNVKLIFVIYLAAVFFLTEPYIRLVYGKRITVFENFLKD